MTSMIATLGLVLIQSANATRPDDVSAKSPAPQSQARFVRAAGPGGCETRAAEISNAGRPRAWESLAQSKNPDHPFAGLDRTLDVLNRYLRICYTIGSLMKSHGTVDPAKELAALVGNADQPQGTREYLVRTFGISSTRARRVAGELREMKQIELDFRNEPRARTTALDTAAGAGN